MATSFLDKNALYASRLRSKDDAVEASQNTNKVGTLPNENKDVISNEKDRERLVRIVCREDTLWSWYGYSRGYVQDGYIKSEDTYVVKERFVGNSSFLFNHKDFTDAAARDYFKNMNIQHKDDELIKHQHELKVNQKKSYAVNKKMKSPDVFMTKVCIKPIYDTTASAENDFNVSVTDRCREGTTFGGYNDSSITCIESCPDSTNTANDKESILTLSGNYRNDTKIDSDNESRMTLIDSCRVDTNPCDEKESSILINESSPYNTYLRDDTVRSVMLIDSFLDDENGDANDSSISLPKIDNTRSDADISPEPLVGQEVNELNCINSEYLNKINVPIVGDDISNESSIPSVENYRDSTNVCVDNGTSITINDNSRDDTNLSDDAASSIVLIDSFRDDTSVGDVTDPIVPLTVISDTDSIVNISPERHFLEENKILDESETEYVDEINITTTEIDNSIESSMSIITNRSDNINASDDYDSSITVIESSREDTTDIGDIDDYTTSFTKIYDRDSNVNIGPMVRHETNGADEANIEYVEEFKITTITEDISIESSLSTLESFNNNNNNNTSNNSTMTLIDSDYTNIYDDYDDSSMAIIDSYRDETNSGDNNHSSISFTQIKEPDPEVNIGPQPIVRKEMDDVNTEYVDEINVTTVRENISIEEHVLPLPEKSETKEVVSVFLCHHHENEDDLMNSYENITYENIAVTPPCLKKGKIADNDKKSDKIASDNQVVDKITSDNKISDKVELDYTISDKVASDKTVLNKKLSDSKKSDKDMTEKNVSDITMSDSKESDSKKSDKKMSGRNVTDYKTSNKTMSERKISDNQCVVYVSDLKKSPGKSSVRSNIFKDIKLIHHREEKVKDLNAADDYVVIDICC